MNTLVHILFKVLWLIAIFALISFGLIPLGINLYDNDFMMNNPWIMTVVQWGALIAGVMGLVFFVKALMGGGHSWCGCNSGSGSNYGSNSGMRKNCPGCGMANCNCR